MRLHPTLESLVQELGRHPLLASLVAAVLHTSGPLTFFGAQALYLGQPILGAFLPSEDVRAIARALEDPCQVQVLVQRLEARVE